MADSKISGLTAAAAAALANEFEINEAGTSKKVTLQQIGDALEFALNGKYAPGSRTISTGEYRVMADQLILNGTEELLIEGDGTLVII